MQANGQKLSAVARRRILQQVTSKSNGGLREESSGNGNAEIPSESTSVQVDNQFSSLVGASAVSFSSSREVEELDRGSVKIRLSGGQKCVVLGTCVLWVKQGTISICGAIVSASTLVYRVYAPSTHALPVIRATSIHAELQLDPLDDGLKALPFIGTRYIWAPAGAKQAGTSFYVLGHSFQSHVEAPHRLKELDIGLWRNILAGVSEFKSGTPQRVLVCGKQSAGLSTLVRCIINRMLAKQETTSNGSSSRGVILVDLDTNLPQFVPPGMISVVHVRNPVFGPPLANLLSMSETGSGRVLRKHFLGSVNSTEVADWHLARVHDLLEHERTVHVEHNDWPVVVTMPEWLSGISKTTAAAIWRKIAPSLVGLLDPSPATSQLEPWLSPAAGDCDIIRVTTQPTANLSTAREHDLQMQSYFHLDSAAINRQFWSETPVLAASRPMTILSYEEDRHAEICAIILLGGHVALEDTYEALHGNLVALVAVRGSKSAADEDDELAADGFAHSSNFDDGDTVRTEEGLPRWQAPTGHETAFAFAAKDSFCLGLALAQEIDIPNRQISFITGPELHVQNVLQHGYRLAVVMQRATPDGRFRPEWAQREMQPRRSRSQAE